MHDENAMALGGGAHAGLLSIGRDALVLLLTLGLAVMVDVTVANRVGLVVTAYSIKRQRLGHGRGAARRG